MPITMSEEGRFRISLYGNVAIVIAITCGAFGLWTTIVQKYDAVDSEIRIMEVSLSKIESKQNAIEELDKRVESQSQHMLVDEQRLMNTESKVDALTSLLNEFMGTIRTNGARPTPSPSPASQ